MNTFIIRCECGKKTEAEFRPIDNERVDRLNVRCECGKLWIATRFPADGRIEVEPVTGCYDCGHSLRDHEDAMLTNEIVRRCYICRKTCSRPTKIPVDVSLSPEELSASKEASQSLANKTDKFWSSQQWSTLAPVTGYYWIHQTCPNDGQEALYVAYVDRETQLWTIPYHVRKQIDPEAAEQIYHFLGPLEAPELPK